MSKIKIIAAKALSALLAVVMTVTFLPLATVAQAVDEMTTEYSFADGSFALHSHDGSILLNEKEAAVKGSVFSSHEFNYTGTADKLVVSGNILEGSDGAVCEIPDYVAAINATANYTETYNSDKEIIGSEIDLTEGSFSAAGKVTLDGTSLIGSGNISAQNDMLIELSGADTSQTDGAVLMSENGDIIVNAASLSFRGVLYAPNGTVKINAKNIDFTGQIYAESIEINGTALNVTYKNFLPDGLICKAAEEDQITVRQGDELPLKGFCNYDDAAVKYTAPDESADYVAIENADTLNPTLTFKKQGTYEITLTAALGELTASDTVKITVTEGPVVHYTSTEDFESGKLSGLSGANDELKPLNENKTQEPVVKEYSLDAESGIAVKSTMDKSSLTSSGDSFNLGYTLTGYGKTVTGNGSDVIIVIDNSGSVRSMTPTIKETVLSILEYMGPNDRFGITSLDYVNTALTGDKATLTAAINKYSLSGGSNYGNGIKVAMSMLEEIDENRNKYIILLADGENSGYDDAVALEQAQLAAEKGVKIYSFEINPFSSNFSDTSTMQQVAIDTKGAYKLCPNAEAISTFMLKMAGEIYNLAARNVTFTTTIMDSRWLDVDSMSKAPDKIENNSDGSVTVTWSYNSFEIDQMEEIPLSLKPNLPANSGYTLITKDTQLISYNDSGKGSVLYLDDIILGENNYSEGGTWTSSVYDSGRDGCVWTLVKWNALYRGNSEINVYLSTSSDGENFGARTLVSNGEELTNFTGRYIKTEIEMNCSEDGSAPVLYDLTIYTDEAVQSEVPVVGNDLSVCGAETVTVGCPLALWLDITGTYDNVSEITWSVDNEENSAVEEISDLRRNYIFSSEGEYTITAAVTAGGIKSESSVKVTVVPEKNLTQSEGGDEYEAVKMTVSDTPAYLNNSNYNNYVTFNISFENPDQVAWMRVLYSTKGSTTKYLAQVNEASDNLTEFKVLNTGYTLSDTVIEIQAFDWYGNMTEEIRTIRLDRSVPTISFNCNKSWIYSTQQATISVSAADNDEIASEVLTCNGEEVQPDENGQYIFSHTEPGSYVFVYTVTDKAGNVSTRNYTLSVKEDATAPSVSIYGSSRVVLGNSVTLAVSASDSQTGLAYVKLMKEDGTVLASYDKASGEIPSRFEYIFTPEALGEYSLIAEAQDNCGNVKQYTYKVTCVADTSRPKVSIALSKTEVLCGTQVTATVTATDDVKISELKFYVDGVEQTLSEDGTFTYLSDDTNLDANGSKRVTFSAAAIDTSGNERTVNSYLTVKKADTTQPTITLSVSKTYAYKNTNAYMTVTVRDNIEVDSYEVYVNNSLVTLDENNRYYFDTSSLCTYDIVVKAKDTSGNEAEKTASTQIIDIQKPTVSVVKDKSSYVMGDKAAFTVTVSDNYAIKTVEATFGGKPVETDNNSFTFTTDELAPGTYTFYVKATDASGNYTEKNTVISVADTEAPKVTLSTEKEKYSSIETPVINYTITDNVGVTKVEATLNDTALDYDSESGKIKLPETFEPGNYTLKIKAYDAANNASEEVSCSFEVSLYTDTVAPVINSVEYKPEILNVGTECRISVDASDDSGDVTLTLTVGDKTLEYDSVNGNWIFTPDTTGTVTLLVHAEDKAGNYAEKEVVLKVYADPDGHKLSVDAPEYVKSGENLTINISSTDGVPFDEVQLWFQDTDISGYLTKNEDGSLKAVLSLSGTGTAVFKAVGKDAVGFEDTVEFSVQFAQDYNTGLQNSTTQASLAQTSETTLSDELKDLADSFENPIDAYEYVYNNVAFEPYVNSRRGAVGTYDLMRGNDVDQASLLIGLLREMGYPAKYGFADIVLTNEQTKSLMAMEDIDSATGMLASAGKSVSILTDTNGEKSVKLRETFVMAYVPCSALGETDPAKKDLGVWVYLDTSVKSSKLSTMEFDNSNYSDYSDAASALVSEYANTDLESTVNELNSSLSAATEIYLTEIEQKEFEFLPSAIQYSFYAADQIAETNSLPSTMCDTVKFQVETSVDIQTLGTYKISELYGKRVTLQYVGNTGSGTIFEMSRSQVASNEFVAALTIDGEIKAKATPDEFFEDYYQCWRLGKKHTLYTTITSGGTHERIKDECVIGSTYAFTFDTGGISESMFYKHYNSALANNPSDKTDPNYPTNATYYDEAKVGSFLSFVGNLYFMMCDSCTAFNAAASNVVHSTFTKMAITSYTVSTSSSSLGGTAIPGTTTISDGSFGLDVSYNNGASFNRVGDIEARNDFMFSTAYMESYFEGMVWTWCMFREGISTVSILDRAVADGANLVYLTKENYSTAISGVDVLSNEKTEIKNAVDEGMVVVIPDKRVTIGSWEGIGYIIGDFENYNKFVFKISGGNNGGADSEDTDLNERLANIFTARIVNSNNSALRDQYIGVMYGMCNALYSFSMILAVEGVGKAAGACMAASGSGLGMAVAGMGLYNSTQDLVEVVNFRVSTIDLFAQYVLSGNKEDEDAAIVGYTKLMLDIYKKMLEMATGDLVTAFKETFFGISEDVQTVESFLESVCEKIFGDEDEEDSEAESA